MKKLSKDGKRYVKTTDDAETLQMYLLKKNARLTNAEIAQKFGLTESTVQKRLYNHKQKALDKSLSLVIRETNEMLEIENYIIAESKEQWIKSKSSFNKKVNVDGYSRKLGKYEEVQTTEDKNEPHYKALDSMQKAIDRKMKLLHLKADLKAKELSVIEDETTAQTESDKKIATLSEMLKNASEEFPEV